MGLASSGTHWINARQNHPWVSDDVRLRIEKYKKDNKI